MKFDIFFKCKFLYLNLNWFLVSNYYFFLFYWCTSDTCLHVRERERWMEWNVCKSVVLTMSYLLISHEDMKLRSSNRDENFLLIFYKQSGKFTSLFQHSSNVWIFVDSSINLVHTVPKIEEKTKTKKKNLQNAA